MDTLESRLAAYIRSRMAEVEALRVDKLERIFGGASRETYRFVLEFRDAEGEHSRRLILRRDPPGSLIDTERAREFGAYCAFYGSDVPVPEPLWLEEDAAWLDHPFFIMEELAGFDADPQKITAPPYAQYAEAFAEQKWSILGRIATADPTAIGIESVMEPVAAESCWRRELDYWEGQIDGHELCPQPVIRAAIRWLRRNPPPPPDRIAVVHGDFRTGNFLYDGDGEIRAILDWEMVHLGDPLEDLAWSIDPVWRWAGDDRAGGLVGRERAIAIWEQAVGRSADADALHWWELFSSVKGQGIWVSGAKEFSDGKNQDLILALSSWLMTNSQNRAALSAMGHLS